MPPQLRLNKVSELIHNSTHHQDVPMARVSVHFIEIIDKVRRRRPKTSFASALRQFFGCHAAIGRFWFAPAGAGSQIKHALLDAAP